MTSPIIRYLIIVCVFIIQNSDLKAQNNNMQFSAWSNNYIYLSSYLGYQSTERFNTFQFSLSSQSYYQKEWSLSIRLLNSIRLKPGSINRSGKDFPAEKINFRWTGDNNDPNMRLQDIGAPMQPVILPSSGESFLINRSRKPLETYGRTSALYQFYNQMTIEPISNLSDYISPDPYTHVYYGFDLLYTLYDSQNKIIGTQTVNYTIQIPPQPADSEPDFSIAVAPGMEEVNISFKSLSDYKHGVSLQIPSGIIVQANTDYEIRLKALEGDIVSSTGKILPLSVMKVTLQNESNSFGTVTPATISTNEQVIFKGISKDKSIKRRTAVKYEVSLPPSLLKDLKIGTYSVSLLYQLMPQ